MSDGNCSFCGKRHDEVFRLLTGPSCNICSECVGRMADMIAGEFRRLSTDIQFPPPDVSDEQ